MDGHKDRRTMLVVTYLLQLKIIIILGNQGQSRLGFGQQAHGLSKDNFNGS